jgi:hypothetical protein
VVQAGIATFFLSSLEKKEKKEEKKKRERKKGRNKTQW